MSAPCSFSESPKPKMPPASSRPAVRRLASSLPLIQMGPRPRMETCQVYQ